MIVQLLHELHGGVDLAFITVGLRIRVLRLHQCDGTAKKVVFIHARATTAKHAAPVRTCALPPIVVSRGKVAAAPQLGRAPRAPSRHPRHAYPYG